MLSNFTSPRVEVRRDRAGQPWNYKLLDQRQREIALRAREGGGGGLLLSEVSPVITLGRRTPGGDLREQPEFFSRNGIAVHSTDRGGLATYHGPGQWVLFAVDRLEKLTGDRRGVRKAVRGLLEVALETGRIYEPRAEIREGSELGVWTPRGKFAAVGIHVENGILLHGLSVNGFRTASSFLGLRPCGLDLPVDFLLNVAPLAEQEAAFVLLGKRLQEAALKRFWH